MTSLQIASVGGTLGMGAVLLMSGLGYPAPPSEDPVGIAFPSITRLALTDVTRAALTWSVSEAPTESDFRLIAMNLALAQESLGFEFEQILARRFEDFLD